MVGQLCAGKNQYKLKFEVFFHREGHILKIFTILQWIEGSITVALLFIFGAFLVFFFVGEGGTDGEGL